MPKINSEMFLEMARDAYSTSTSYFDANYRKKIDNAYRHAQNKHHAGSKYYKDSYKYRSKGFRPKTRSFINQNMAKAMVAFFSNQDVVSVEPVDPNNAAQVASALINKELLNYRLTKTIPWFKICLGGVQDAVITGVVCSYQYWTTESKKEAIASTDELGEFVYDADGNPAIEVVEKITRDEPVISLRPIENIRISPSADWLDPINSSPYLIDLLPMHVIDVEAKMRETNKKTGEPRWKKYSRAEMATASKRSYDQTEQARLGGSEDPHTTNQSKPLSGYDTVWVHRNFMRYGGNDYVFYTLGTEHMLTDPVPIEDVYWHGKRPYALGSALIESHKVLPDSPVHLVSHLQQLANEINNQRLDNVKLAMNKRFIAKRGAGIDLRTLVSNVAGSVTLADSPSDVIPIDFPDVTGSSYQEQDRVNMDFDDLAGAFSASSVGTNRKLGETVGGMSMLRSAGNEINELFIKTIAETWLEQVMGQLVKLEQKYESDLTLLTIAAQNAQVYERFGVDATVDELLEQELTTTVNMGIDATDPMRRTERLLFAVGRISEIMANPTPGLNKDELIKEVFGSLGYKDGSRFYVPEEGPPPEVQEMQQVIEQMQQQIEQMVAQLNDKAEDRQLKADMSEADRQLKAAQMQQQAELKMAELQARSQDAERNRDAADELNEDTIAADLIKTKFIQDAENKRQGAKLAQDILTKSIDRADSVKIHEIRREGM